MASWDVITAELLRTAASVDADVQLRLRTLQQQCQKLQKTDQFLHGLERALVAEKSAQQAETLNVQQSIQDAIRRARQVRAELATGQEEDKEEDEQLQSILTVAKATRAVETEQTRAEPMPTPRVLHYPRQLKALETQLGELRDRERHASARFAFCCKMSEHLSLSAKRRQLIVQLQERNGRMELPVAHIQTSFPKQEAKLRLAYQLLMAFMVEKVEVQSPAFQEVACAPTFSTAFPVYHRLKQAKKMLRLLNSETKAFMERAPPSPPTLSAAAKSHRDAILARIRRKKPRAGVGVVDNEALLSAARETQSPLDVEAELWQKLQAAWVARVSSKEVHSESLTDVYCTTVREIVLTELSNAVLWSFKTHFAESSEPPDAQQVEAVMRLVRLVDSVALSQGRTYRSVVTS